MRAHPGGTRGGFLGLSLALALAGCDKDPPKKDVTPTTSATAAPSAIAAPTAPTTPQKPQLALDDTAAFIAGERLEIGGADAKSRLSAGLAGKLVEGETLVLNAARDTKMPKVVLLFSALQARKVKAVEIHTPLRDRSAAELVFTTSTKPADCSAVGYIAKDSTINTWTVGGANAERFSHGMAGPDLTRGAPGIRKRVLACEASPVWFASADDNVTWGLVFDVAVAVMRPEDAGLPKARSVAVLLKTPVPGRKVETDVVE